MVENSKQYTFCSISLWGKKYVKRTLNLLDKSPWVKWVHYKMSEVLLTDRRNFEQNGFQAFNEQIVARTTSETLIIDATSSTFSPGSSII